MNKINFFGRCIGAKVAIEHLEAFGKPENIREKPVSYCGILTGIGESQYIPNTYVVDVEDGSTFYEFDINDCQIIGRRIKDMTDEEKYQAVEVVYNYGVKWSGKESWMSIFESMFPRNDEFVHERLYEWLFDIGVYPDKYFDNGWCVHTANSKVNHRKRWRRGNERDNNQI